MNYNRVILGGRLTADPEFRVLPGSGEPLCKFRLATNRSYKNAKGEKQDEACFIDVTAWGKQATLIHDFFGKGKPILIEGRLRFEVWESKADNKTHTKHTIVAERIHFTDSRPKTVDGITMSEDEAHARAESAPPSPPAPAPAVASVGPAVADLAASLGASPDLFDATVPAAPVAAPVPAVPAPVAAPQAPAPVVAPPPAPAMTSSMLLSEPGSAVARRLESNRRAGSLVGAGVGTEGPGDSIPF